MQFSPRTKPRETPSPPSTGRDSMKIALAIQLNNHAVEALYAGDLDKGYRLLLHTFVQSRKRSANHQQTEQEAKPLEFLLKDCSRGLSLYAKTKSDLEKDTGNFRFLSMTFLKVDRGWEGCSLDLNAESHHPMVWALEYNLAVTCALIGMLRGVAHGGKVYLRKSLQIMSSAKRHVMMHNVNSPFWINLKLAVLNNFIFAAKEYDKLDVSKCMALMEELLRSQRSHLDPVDIKKFYFSLQFMGSTVTLAPAA
eukprot:Nitzschia sp. Nitz4//scaffold5_size260463//95391//96238//NITZ4_000971-RA/size260463-augustus-gene-0.9-mRNA-1//1//CDS//3329555307//1305//frame0